MWVSLTTVFNHPLVPKLYLGTEMVAKLELGESRRSQAKLGNEKKRRPAGSPLRLILTLAPAHFFNPL